MGRGLKKRFKLSHSALKSGWRWERKRTGVLVYSDSREASRQCRILTLWPYAFSTFSHLIANWLLARIRNLDTSLLKNRPDVFLELNAESGSARNRHGMLRPILVNNALAIGASEFSDRDLFYYGLSYLRPYVVLGWPKSWPCVGLHVRCFQPLRVSGPGTKYVKLL